MCYIWSRDICIFIFLHTAAGPVILAVTINSFRESFFKKAKDKAKWDEKRFGIRWLRQSALERWETSFMAHCISTGLCSTLMMILERTGTGQVKWEGHREECGSIFIHTDFKTNLAFTWESTNLINKIILNQSCPTCDRGAKCRPIFVGPQASCWVATHRQMWYFLL